jgi:hypothetical protein
MNMNRGPLVLAGLLLLAACRSSFSPTPVEQVGFKERAETQSTDRVTITTAVLSADEARQVFDGKLYKKKIQPIWLEITNHTNELILFLPSSLDPLYFSPLEAAQKAGWTWKKERHREAADFFYGNQIELQIQAGWPRSSVRAGATTSSSWSRYLVSRPTFTGSIPMPSIRARTSSISTNRGCGRGSRSCRVASPTLTAAKTATRSTWSSSVPSTLCGLPSSAYGLFGGAYRHAPISSLYLFGRSQDLALQKVRSNIHYRNHLRLWLAPVTFDGTPVLVGQISRDIGSRMTTKSSTLTTHRIDPDVDETRASLVQDLIYSQGLRAFAYAGGVGAAPRSAPRTNLTGDVYFTDGLRLVMLLTDEPTTILDIEFYRWEDPSVEPDEASDAKPATP